MCWKPLQNYFDLMSWVGIAAAVEFETMAVEYQRKRTGGSEALC